MTNPAPYWPANLPRTLDVPRTSLYHNLDVSAARYPEKTALHFYGREVTYRELLEQTARLSGQLQRAGVGRGDRVLVWFQNSPQFVVAAHAVWRAGGVVVPLSPMLVPDELRFFLADAGITVGVVGAELYAKARAAGLGRIVVGSYGEGIPDAPAALAVPAVAEGDDVTWADALAGEPGVVVPVGAEDLAVLPYTSGTTGRPKGCMHTHGSVQANVVAGGAWVHATSSDVQLATLPYFHVTGMVNSMLAPIYGGSAAVVMNRWDRQVAADLMERYGVTLWTNTATMVIDLLANPNLRPEQLRTLRFITGGGAALPAAVGAHLENLTGLRYAEGYGLTETMAQTHTNPAGRPKLQCLGIPVFGTSARILNPDTLEDVPDGQTGEIVVSGPQVFQGYWQRPDATAEAFLEREGQRYFRTGDLGYRDAEGYYFFTDRLKRMVNVSGMKVWPAEVESALFQHPAVQQACVIGVPDARTGERARALIVLKAGASATGEEIEAWAREHLAAYKIPRDWQFVDALPIGGTGKVNWRALQEQARAQMQAP
ncbi:long-chain-fatty-acid--CoA ligase [Deinococcus maricopensis]|uniref:Long-chain-fatty-acid--CoA ligase n=1 Tax=Deinococcus maricopensis (strain DSM 21211 / LMG 22137 / NRRL B-23946 / LB-34) TaxID=709986 RepID=E8U3B9_DEIML|nr:long-chain-fatty-acid--CoA ligase [Deinococcus maricopensis]ADV65790.1 Long-chain-fatty-acid--CoA ligase [Deinococcus maricopensis DSM 21211]